MTNTQMSPAPEILNIANLNRFTPDLNGHTPSAGPKEDSSLPPLSLPVSKPRRARVGKVARLPYLERDMVNRMLRNNIKLSRIADALGEHDFQVTERNISNWKTRGGYREWCESQDRAAETRLRQDNLTEFLRPHGSAQIPEIGLQLAATSLSEYFARPEVQQQLARDPEKFSKTLATLCQIANRLQSMERQRQEQVSELGATHNLERANRSKEKEIELTRLVFSADPSPGQKPSDPLSPHRNYFPRESAPDSTERFGPRNNLPLSLPDGPN